MTDYAVLLIAPCFVGVVVGRLCGGSLRTIGNARLRAVWLVWLAAAVQVVQLVTDTPLLAVVFVLFAIWVAMNITARRAAAQWGLGLVSVGLLANGVAIAANGRMPYSIDAAEAAGLTPTLTTPKNAPADLHTVLFWMGDVIPVAPLHAVISIGDVAIAIGVAVLVAALMQDELRMPIAERR